MRLAAAALLLWPAIAYAHTALQSSSPAKDAIVTEPLTELRLRFNESVEPAYTKITLRGPDGIAVPLQVIKSVAGSDNREFVTGPTSALLTAGRYTVEWRTAGSDSHVVTGSFTFEVQISETTDSIAVMPGVVNEEMPPEHHEVVTGSDAPAPESVMAVVIRWLNFTALIGLIGGVIFRIIVLPRASVALESSVFTVSAARKAWRFTATAAGIAVIALVARLWLQSATLHGLEYAWDGERLWSMLSLTGWGTAWLLQFVATLILVGGIIASRGSSVLNKGWTFTAAAIMLMAFVPALSGHAAAIDNFGFIAVLSDTLHILAGGAWIGTLAALLLCGLPAAVSLPSEQRAAAIAAQVREFSRIALLAVGLIVLTGVISILFHLHRPSDLTRTSYGLALMIKLGILLVVLGAGFYNWRYVQPRLAADAAGGSLRTSATIELAGGILVILVTAVLVALPTP